MCKLKCRLLRLAAVEKAPDEGVDKGVNKKEYLLNISTLTITNVNPRQRQGEN